MRIQSDTIDVEWIRRLAIQTDRQVNESIIVRLSEIEDDIVENTYNLSSNKNNIFIKDISVPSSSERVLTSLRNGFQIANFSIVNCAALATDRNGNVFAGGQAMNSSMTGVIINNIGYWNPSMSQWFPMGNGLTGSSLCSGLAVDGQIRVYAVGNFQTIGNGLAVNRVARWDSSTLTWSALGSGVDNVVNAVAIDDEDRVYIGGLFTTATDSVGTKTVNRVAMWNPVTSLWSPLGSGVSGGNINAIAIDSQNRVYVGGTFLNATDSVSTKTVNRIAMWDPTTSLWSPLGSGMNNNSVLTIAIDSQDRVYVGGSFTGATDSQGSKTLNRIGMWDPSISLWFPVGSGLNGNVSAIAIDSQDQVYLGGSFQVTSDNAVVLNRIAIWDGTEYLPIGTGLDDTCSAITIDGNDNVYISGVFVMASGVAANKIVKYTRDFVILNFQSETVATLSNQYDAQMIATNKNDTAIAILTNNSIVV